MTEKFRQLGLDEEILKAIEEHKFEIPSEIQEKAIPLALQGKDIIGGSATGSGKTLAFGASILQNTIQGNGIQALILTPTRELAEQISDSLKRFSKYKKLKIAAIYGGVSINPQIDALKQAEIVIGTPGRILDHTERRTINYENIKVLVLDEADRMLDMGFIDDVEKIISFCPKQRQTMLFSATISADIEHLTKKYMKNPVEVSVESYVDASQLEQIYYDTPGNMKFSTLVYLLKKEKSKLVMVFCNTQRNTDFIARELTKQEILAQAIHGGLTQARRTRVLEKFHHGKTEVLVCTDVAARGLDIKHVSHVYNYDAPKTSKEYIHRIGRTARAGKQGKAITLISDRDYENFRNIMRDESIKIKEEKITENVPMIIVQFNRGRFGKRDNRREYSPRQSFRNNSEYIPRTNANNSLMATPGFFERRHSNSRHSHSRTSSHTNHTSTNYHSKRFHKKNNYFKK